MGQAQVRRELIDNENKGLKWATGQLPWANTFSAEISENDTKNTKRKDMLRFIITPPYEVTNPSKAILVPKH